MIRLLPFIIFIFIFISPSTSFANFSVTPLRVDLTNNANTGSLTVENHGEKPITVQVSLKEWTQDDDGKDVFVDSPDLLFFPKVATIVPGKKQLVRVGVKGVFVEEKEKTYRLFISKIISPEERAETKAAIMLRTRFGIPVFLKGTEEKSKLKVKGELGQVLYTGSAYKVPVLNTGNEYFMIKSVEVVGVNEKGDELFKEKIKGWYLLDGKTRVHEIKVDRKLCKEAVKLKILVMTDKMEIDGEIDGGKTLCERE